MASTRQNPPDATSSGEAYLGSPVLDVASRQVLWIEPDAPVSEAARRMLDAGTGSILVRAAAGDGDGPGIVTDRDLRRVLAEGLGGDAPVGAIASRPLRTLPRDASVATAHLVMLEAGVRHLALVASPAGASPPDARAPESSPEPETETETETESERIVGVVSSTDLHRHQSRGPFFVLHRLDDDHGGLARGDYLRHRTAAMRSLRLGGVAAERIGRIGSHLDDHLVRRCLEAEIDAVASESGPLPAPWAWLAFGSDGRREQPVLLDQHNALVYDLGDLDADAAARASEIFHRLAARVTQRLLASGWPEPGGGFVAGRWCAHLGEWRRRYRHWLEEPDAEALEHAQVFFDLRPVAGDLDVDPAGTLREIEPHADFLRLLAAMAARRRPAVGRWRGLRKNGDGEIDLVEGGLRPLVALARVLGVCLALDDGRWWVSTPERLGAAGRAGLLPRDDADRLVQIYQDLADRCLDRLLEAPFDAPRRGAGLRPGDLSRHERRRLTSDLRFLRRQQSRLDGAVRRRQRRGATEGD